MGTSTNDILFGIASSTQLVDGRIAELASVGDLIVGELAVIIVLCFWIGLKK